MRGRIGRVAAGPADVRPGGMHTGREQADQRQRLGLADLVLRPQAELLAEIGKDGRVLGDDRAVVEHEGRHAAVGMDLEIGVRALLAGREVHALRLVRLAAFLQHDVRREGTGARRIVELHQSSLLETRGRVQGQRVRASAQAYFAL